MADADDRLPLPFCHFAILPFAVLVVSLSDAIL